MNLTTENRVEQIRAILHPRSVAIVGASEDESKWGGRLMKYMLRHRLDGALYPINPKAATVMGINAYPSVAQCPGAVDMAVILLPKERVEAALEDCIAKGVKSIVAITAGYAEAGEEGLAAQEALVDRARSAGIRIIGPNCMGLMNAHHNLAATTGMLMGVVDELPKGGIGMASQSGALMGALLARGVEMGAGFSSTISVGNQADLDINDFFEYMISDPKTEIITLYVEQVPDGERFMRLLSQAHEAEKPVLILKAGRTTSGAKAVSSHTASLAGPYAVFEAACRAKGAFLFETPFDMLQAALILQRETRMSSNRVAVFSGSGGGNALIVDQLKDTGLELATLTSETTEKLLPYLGAAATLPVDLASLSAHSTKGSPLAEVLETVMQDPGVGAGIMLLTTQPNMEFVADAVESVGSRCGKPVIFIHAASGVGEAAKALLRSRSYGYVESPHDGIAVMKALNDQRRYPVAAPQPVPSMPLLPQDLPSGYLNEAQARRLLESFDIPLSNWHHADSYPTCLQAANEIGFPVVLKAVSSAIVHKSDHGLVKIRIKDGEELRDAYESLQATMSALDAPFEGVIVTEMAAIEYELIAGVNVDPDFGPMILLGSGGVLVEVTNDTQLAQAPISQEQAHVLIRSLQCYPILQGYRGRGGADLEELASILVKLSHLAWAYRDRLTELDINPLALVDGKLLALDARATIRK